MNRLLALCGAFALTALLAACTISSTDLLISDDEAATPLPASFMMFSYRDDPEGFRIAPDTPPAPLTQNGKAYATADNELSVRFVPLDAADTYLMAATQKDGSVYGVAHYANNILEMHVIISGDVEKLIAEAGLPDATVKDDGIAVTTRAGLDAAIALLRSGKIDAGPLVAYIGEPGDSEAPELLIRDGDVLKPKS